MNKRVGAFLKLNNTLLSKFVSFFSSKPTCLIPSIKQKSKNAIILGKIIKGNTLQSPLPQLHQVPLNVNLRTGATLEKTKDSRRRRLDISKDVAGFQGQKSFFKSRSRWSSKSQLTTFKNFEPIFSYIN